jgi:D-beta-D-heptose 7-phosphate kinase/D-beta-D-heptose 1-phosphate adenosyltransferase
VHRLKESSLNNRFNPPSVSQVEQLLRSLLGRRVAVIGDSMLDAYIIGSVARISPEAPVPVLNVQREEFMLGGAANVAKCLVALGAKVRLCTVVGDDSDGQLFCREAQSLGIDLRGVIADHTRPTTRKTRVVARQQQVIRLDQETNGPLPASLEQRLIRKVQQACTWADAVVLSDYGKGVLTFRLCQAAIKAARQKPTVVDPKDLPWDRYRGATLIKPNLHETALLLGSRPTDAQAAGQAARSVAKKLAIANVLITRGGEGMTLLCANSSPSRKSGGGAIRHFPAATREVFDVTGAGDAVAAVLAVALASGTDHATAAWLANVAAGVKVGKFGASAVAGQEILQALGSTSPGEEKKVMSREQARLFAADMRRRGRKVVFTNGCFDILHVGHVNYLQKSRRLGDALVVGLNTDASVRRLKGPGRPVQNERDRAHILAAQSCVDAVVLFDEDTPIELIKAVRPDILTKGADYKRKQDVKGWDLVESWGGRVERIELVKGRSTTDLIRKAKAKH